MEGIEIIYSDGVLDDPMAAAAGGTKQQQQLSSKCCLRLEGRWTYGFGSVDSLIGRLTLEIDI